MSSSSDTTVHTCPKCSGTMKMGTIPDFGHGRIYQPFWIEGRMQFGFWGNLKNPQYPIQAARCEKCGYVELFASTLAARNQGFWGQ